MIVNMGCGDLGGGWLRTLIEGFGVGGEGVEGGQAMSFEDGF